MARIVSPLNKFIINLEIHLETKLILNQKLSRLVHGVQIAKLLMLFILIAVPIKTQ